mmetsp:Transcript_21361/g.59732  ORF Transcript_21361/g.59732 Transcript_21361/m.59732 type:complete len:92 (-) Transcript_21361:45-320(-)
MIRTLRRPLLVLASIVAFGTTLSNINLIGILMALSGAWLYSSDYHGPVIKKNVGWGGLERQISNIERQPSPRTPDSPPLTAKNPYKDPWWH